MIIIPVNKKKKKKSEDIAPVFSEETKQAVKTTAKANKKFQVAEVPTGVTVSSPLIPTVSDISNNILGIQTTSVQPTVTFDTNKDGYTYFGKTFGDYDFHNFSTMGNYKIYKKDDKYYYYDEKDKKYKSFGNMSYMSSPKYDKDYEEAINAGKKYDYSKLSLMDQLKLDSTDLNQEEYSKYSKDLERQQEKKEQAYENKYARQNDTPGIQRAITTTKNIANKVNEEIIQPVSDLGELYEAGKKSNDLSLEYYNQMMGKENNAEEMQKEYDKYSMFNEDLLNDKTWGGTAIKNANVQVQSIKNQGIAATILGVGGAGIGALIGGKPGAIAGAKIGEVNIKD